MCLSPSLGSLWDFLAREVELAAATTIHKNYRPKTIVLILFTNVRKMMPAQS